MSRFLAATGVRKSQLQSCTFRKPASRRISVLTKSLRYLSCPLRFSYLSHEAPLRHFLWALLQGLHCDYNIKSERETVITFVGLSSYPLVLWLHSRIAPESQMSSSECLLSEEQMQGRHPFCRGFVIQRRVQKSTGLIDAELAIGYVLAPKVIFDLIIYPG